MLQSAVDGRSSGNRDNPNSQMRPHSIIKRNLTLFPLHDWLKMSPFLRDVLFLCCGCFYRISTTRATCLSHLTEFFIHSGRRRSMFSSSVSDLKLKLKMWVWDIKLKVYFMSTYNNSKWYFNIKLRSGEIVWIHTWHGRRPSSRCWCRSRGGRDDTAMQ